LPILANSAIDIQRKDWREKGNRRGAWPLRPAKFTDSAFPSQSVCPARGKSEKVNGQRPLAGTLFTNRLMPAFAHDDWLQAVGKDTP
jgi:hypothetical protein